MDQVNRFVSALNDLLFHDYVVFALLLTGLLFTVWSGFGQYRALTHGVGVIRGKYDKRDAPGAINHFQALSAALSATVGLGNIAGVAVAVALGGPGAVFWMWVIGLLGMALKMTEVTQSMLYRNLDNPDEPHGGPMFVVRHGLAKRGFGKLGNVVGGIFCVTLILSAITGGNMFQAWNVAAATSQYVPGIPRDTTAVAIGVILAIIVGIVIIGGIKRIGAVTGRLVPLMCALYLLAGFYVLALNIGDIPGLVVLIVRSGLGLESAGPQGAFLGGAFGYAALWGVKRALFSSEAGQGSAPIAHAAAKCDEPVREGVVAGLEPFVDTLVVCTVTALVILSSGAWDRGPEGAFGTGDGVAVVSLDADGDGQQDLNDDGVRLWTIRSPGLPPKNEEARRINRILPTDPGWRDGNTVFMLVSADDNPDTASSMHRIDGSVNALADGNFTAAWGALPSSIEPTLVDEGIYVNYAGAGLTAHAFDRVQPGLGLLLVVAASWLFAVSTMISWSYYGEQGVVYLFGSSPRVVLVYRLLYCLLVFVSTLPFISTDQELDMWTTLGLGAMLVVNVPIMLVFGREAMSEYSTYIGRLKRGEFHSHAAQRLTDLVSGDDVKRD